MKVSVTNIQQGSDSYSVTVSDDGQNQVASVSKNGKEIKQIKFKKDSDIALDLKDIIASDIKNGKI
jgi:hypothetical protein